MAAKKFSKNAMRSIVAYFKSSNKSLAINRFSLRIGSKIEIVNGFLGVDAHNNNVLYGAITTGSGTNLWSLVFEVNMVNKAYTFTYPELPAGLTQVKAKRIVLDLCKLKRDEIHDKMVEISLKIKKKGGPPPYRPMLKAYPKDNTGLHQ